MVQPTPSSKASSTNSPDDRVISFIVEGTIVEAITKKVFHSFLLMNAERIPELRYHEYRTHSGVPVENISAWRWRRSDKGVIVRHN